MTKITIALAMLLSSFQVEYVNVDSIEYYQNNSNIKEFIFNFSSDYLSSHKIDVSIAFYAVDNTFIRQYSNQLSFIGNKTSIAKINCDHIDNVYALINVIYSGKHVLKNARINIYKQEGCYLNTSNNICDRIYKSKYLNGYTYDEKLIFTINNSIFHTYLPLNRVNVEKIDIYTNVNLKDAVAHLNIKDKIEGYDLLYFNQYSFLLEYDNQKDNFVLMDKYFYALDEFKYSEKYFNNSIKTDYIYLPFRNDINEYNLELIIESFVDIKVSFVVYTVGELFGDCSYSKYCLVRE